MWLQAVGSIEAGLENLLPKTLELNREAMVYSRRSVKSNYSPLKLKEQLPSVVTRALPAALFLFFLSVYTIILPVPRDTTSIDCLFMLRVCQSLVEGGDYYDQCRKEDRAHIQLYSQYPIAPSLVAAPFYALAKLGLRLWGRPPDSDTLFTAATWSSAVVSALTCLLLFHFVLSLGYSLRAGLLLTFFYGLSTTAVWQARFLYGETVNALSILGAAYMAYLYKTTDRPGWLYLSGFLAGLAAASRDVSVIIVPPLLVYLLATKWAKTKNAPLRTKIMTILSHNALFLAGLVPFLALNIWYNFERFGLSYNVFYLGLEGSLSHAFQTPLLVGLFGFLFSPGRSLFLYWPVVILGIFSFKPFYRKYKAESLLVLSIFLSHLLIYSKCNYWIGGGSGPRYLFPTLPLLVLPVAAFLEALPTRSYLTKAGVLFLFCAGVMTQAVQIYLTTPPVYDRIAQLTLDLYLDNTTSDVYPAEFTPYAHPIFWVPYRGDLKSFFYFFPGDARSLRLPALAILLVIAMSTGIYLFKKMDVAPSYQDLRSLFAKVLDRIRDGVQVSLLCLNKRAAGMGALLLIVLALGSYSLFNYVWVPIRHFNSKPFGGIEYPKQAYVIYDGKPLVTGIMEVSGWLLDQSGIQAIEVYIDDTKVANATYGYDSPHVQFPNMPNSHRAGFRASDIDTSAFSNGMHSLLVTALNGRGKWSRVTNSVVFFLNERPYDFFAHVPDSKTGEEDAIEDSQLSINQEPRRVFLQRPNSTVTFAQVPVHNGAVLTLGIGVSPEDDSDSGRGLVLEVLANTDTPVLAMTINPKAVIDQQKWIDERIDLSPFANQVIALTFAVKTQAGHSNMSYRIGWSDLKIAYPESEESMK